MRAFEGPSPRDYRRDAARNTLPNAMTTSDLPEPKRLAEEISEATAIGTISSIPGVGNVLGELFALGLNRGRTRQIEQFLGEVKALLLRHETRIGQVELEAYLGRQQAAAAFRCAGDAALKSASIDKHRLLASAFANVATSPEHDGVHEMSGFFWSLIERHSPTEVRLLAAYDDPINRARVNGVTRTGKLQFGDYLFASVPELRWDFKPIESNFERSADHEAAGGGFEESEIDAEEPDDPAFWRWDVYTTRLRADGLIEDDNPSLDSELIFGDEHGHAVDYDPKPFGQATALGEAYLAFLDLESAEAAV